MAKRKKSNEDLPEENIENTSDADSFGLPDIDYKPIDRTENVSEEPAPEQVAEEPAPQVSDSQHEEQPRAEHSYVYEAPEEKSKAPIIIGIVITAVVVIAGFLIYNFVYKPKAEKERQEQLAKAEKDRKAKEEERLAREREEAERLKREAEAAANAKPAEGTVEILSAPTKRYYVVVTSAVDGDLTMDYAKKLSSKGVSTKIIPPFGKWKFNRLAIGDYDTFALAQTNADAAKTEYGDGVWVIKY